jgi:hypothetical protein
MIFLLYKRKGVYRARRRRAVCYVNTDRVVYNMDL